MLQNGIRPAAAVTPAVRADLTTWARAERAAAGILPNTKRRCYQRRSGAPTRGTGPLRLALAGATRSGTAGVGSPGSRSGGEATSHPRESIATTINFRPAAITNRDIAAPALLIASRLALTAALDALEQRAATRNGKRAPLPRGGKGLLARRERFIGLELGFRAFAPSHASLLRSARLPRPQRVGRAEAVRRCLVCLGQS